LEAVSVVLKGNVITIPWTMTQPFGATASLRIPAVLALLQDRDYVELHRTTGLSTNITFGLSAIQFLPFRPWSLPGWQRPAESKRNRFGPREQGQKPKPSTERKAASTDEVNSH
jgi:hypothetical protein